MTPYLYVKNQKIVTSSSEKKIWINEKKNIQTFVQTNGEYFIRLHFVSPITS